jgi:hypothetical protein
VRETWIIVYNNNGRLSICTVYHTRVDARNHGGLGIFGAVVWVSFELLPFAGAVMGAVTGKAPAPPPPRSAPPPPLALGDPAVSDPLFEAAGFELCGGAEGDRTATVSFPMDDLDVALNLLRAARLGPSGGDGGVGGGARRVARYEAAWPEVAKARGHLTDDGQFCISGVYRVIVARRQP